LPPQPSIELVRLLRRIGNRDHTAFEAFYDHFHCLAYGIGLRMLGDASKAENLTIAVFLKVWNAPESFITGNVEASIARFARDAALSTLRGQMDLVQEELPAGLSSAEINVVPHADRLSVRAAIATLPAHQCEVLELAFFEGLTHQEIAQRTGMTPNTCKAQLRVGLRSVRSALENTAARESATQNENVSPRVTGSEQKRRNEDRSSVLF
jgi:RNA polymerase sigma-70 factor (ECF subfamily)